MPSRWRSYRDVDAAQDPRRLSEQLNAIASIPVVALEKDRSLDLLELQSGASVLDVGCGNGADLHRLADLVGARGRVVGLDRSAALIADASARDRAGAGPAAVELLVGDADALPFAEAEFDAARSDRTLQHLPDPVHAVGELARVTKPSGRVVVTESRWGLVAPALDRAVTARVTSALATEGERRDPVSDRLSEILGQAGLTGVSVHSHDHTLDDAAELMAFANLEWSLDQAVCGGALTAPQADDWRRALRELVAAGEAFAVVRFVHAVGVRP